MALVNGNNLYQEYIEAQREFSLVAAAKVQLSLIGQINSLVRTQLEILYQVSHVLKERNLQQAPEAEMIKRIDVLLDETYLIVKEVMTRVQTMTSF